MSAPYRYYIDDGRVHPTDNTTIITTPATEERQYDKCDGGYSCTIIDRQPAMQETVYRHHVATTWCATLPEAIEWIQFTQRYGIYTAVRCADDLLVMPYRWQHRYADFGTVRQVAPDVGCLTLTSPQRLANQKYIQSHSGVPADVAGVLADSVSEYIEDTQDETINVIVHAVLEPTKLLLYAVSHNDFKMACLAMRMGANANYAVYKINSDTITKIFALVYRNCCVTGKHYLIARAARLSIQHPIPRWLLRHDIVKVWPVKESQYFEYDSADWRIHRLINDMTSPISLFEYVHNYPQLNFRLLLTLRWWQ